MSLYEPIPQADLSPHLPDSDKLTWREWEDYGHLFVWVFWRPHSLTSYLRKYKKLSLGSAENVGDNTVVEPYRKIVDDLYLLAFFLTQFLVVFVSMGYWATLASVGVLNGMPAPSIGDLFASLMAGLLIVFLVHVIIRVGNEQFFRTAHRTDSAIAAMIILGLVGGITAGIYFLDSFAGDFLFRTALVSSGIGAAIGLTLSTLTYYIKIETTQRSFIFLVLSLLVFIIVATLFGGLLTRSFSFMWVVLICMALSFTLTALRVDDWMLGQLLKSTALTKRDLRKLPRVTPLPIIGLRLELEDWLDWDWAGGLKNIKEIRTYTRQDPMTSLAIRQILKESSDDKDKRIVAKVEQLQKTFSDMDLRHFSPAKLSSSTSRNFMGQSVSQLVQPTTQQKGKRTRQEERQEHRQQRRTRERRRVKFMSAYDDRLLADAAIAGYSFLQLNHPERAINAFEKVTHDDLGKEMLEISKALNTLWYAEKLPENAPLALAKQPEDSKHKDTWKTFTRFQDIVRYVWLLRRSRNPNNYATVSLLIQNKLAELKANLPDVVEGEALAYIANDWEIEAANLIDTMGHLDQVKQIENPYIFAEPLSSGSKGLLKGRKEQLDLIKAAWRVGNFQPLLIYGQRHMGKTSLIRCADAQFSKTVRMAYINLRQLSGQAAPRDLFLTICDAVGELRIHPAPTQEQIFAAPYREFRQYIHECASRLGSVGLVIVLDELEHLTADVERSGILTQSIQQLWMLAQLDPNLGVILITTRNPSELMNDNDQNLLTSSVQPVEVGYLTRDDIAPLLRNPTPKFLPFCTDKALERILFWTAGQPYLTQLLAYCLIEHYNAQVSALNGQRDPLFTTIDIDGTIQRSDFRHQCERYFRDILEEAVAIDGRASDILNALSEKRMGMAVDSLEQALAMPVEGAIMAQLGEHQIIRFTNERWQIIVELFRWWLRDRS